MIFLVGYKTTDVTQNISLKNLDVFSSRRPFILANEEDIENNSNYQAIYQLIQDFDFSQKLNKNSELNIIIIDIDPKILSKNQRTMVKIKEVVSNYSVRIIYNIIHKNPIINDKFIKIILKKKISYNDFEKRNFYKKNNNLHQIEQHRYKSWLSKFNYDYKYPFRQFLYIYLNRNDNENLVRLPIEIIDIICNFLHIPIHIDINCHYTNSFSGDTNIYVTTPSITFKHNLLNYNKNFIL